MKKLLSLVAGFFLAGTIFAQSIPNGGFENWDRTTWANPQGYINSNSQNISKGAAPNVSQVAGYAGNYGVSLQTIAVGQNIQPGYILDGVPGNSGFVGGIPTGYTTQIPTGIRFWYKYAPNTNDTAVVLVMFKKGGATIDSIYILLKNAEANYTLHTQSPIQTLTQAPDTIIFGAVSSIAALKSHNGGGHIGSVLTIDSVSFTGVPSQPAALNGDFLTWNYDTNYIPAYWYTSYPNAGRTTDAKSGMYALWLATDSTNSGQASTGYYPNCQSNCNELGGNAYVVPVSGLDTLEFAYKYTPRTNDTATVQLRFIKNGQQVNNINGGYFSVENTVSSYKDTSIAINFNSNAVDTVIVNISSSSHNNTGNSFSYIPYVGSTFEIDNLTFASLKSTLGVNKITATDGIKVYPNPTKNQINIDLSNVSGSVSQIAIYDMSGRVLNTQSYSGTMHSNIETIDVSGFSTGIYLVEVTTTKGRFYQKVSKE